MVFLRDRFWVLHYSPCSQSNDLLSSVKSGSVYMYADDTTVFSIGADTDSAISQLNEALKELYSWCLKNRLTPHPCKSEAMLLTRTNRIGPIAPIHIGASVIEWVKKTRLLGMTVDHKISWVPHTLEIKRNFVKKLDLRGVWRGNNTVAMRNFNRSYFGRFTSNGHETWPTTLLPRHLRMVRSMTIFGLSRDQNRK